MPDSFCCNWNNQKSYINDQHLDSCLNGVWKNSLSSPCIANKICTTVIAKGTEVRTEFCFELQSFLATTDRQGNIKERESSFESCKKSMVVTYIEMFLSL